MSLEVHKKIPSFVMYDEEGNKHTSEMHQGKWLLLYFYPKDDTPGCTKEACNFRDFWEELSYEGVMVLGVSA
jgi:peroxiredoxin Q/BCP